MGSFKIKEKDVLFILKEQLDYKSLCKLDKFKDLNEKALDMLVTEAIAFAKGVVDPLQEVGEEQGVFFKKGVVKVPEELKKAFKLYGENGWIAVARDEKHKAEATLVNLGLQMEQLQKDKEMEEKKRDELKELSVTKDQDNEVHLQKLK